jgi:hypothetical protein
MTRWPFWLRAMESFDATSARPPDLEKGATCSRCVRRRRRRGWRRVGGGGHLGGDDDHAELLVLLLLHFAELRLDLFDVRLGLGLRLGLAREQHVHDLLLLRGRRSRQPFRHRGLVQSGVAV